MNQNKALWYLFLACVITIVVCFLINFTLTVLDYHRYKNKCSFEHTEECKCVNFRPYLKHEAFNYDLK